MTTLRPIAMSDFNQLKVFLDAAREVTYAVYDWPDSWFHTTDIVYLVHWEYRTSNLMSKSTSVEMTFTSCLVKI